MKMAHWPHPCFSGQRPWCGFTDSWRTPRRVRQWDGQKVNDPKWKRCWGYLKLTVWTIAVLAVVGYAWALLHDNEVLHRDSTGSPGRSVPVSWA
jgi:hypothetical protein